MLGPKSCRTCVHAFATNETAPRAASRDAQHCGVHDIPTCLNTHTRLISRLAKCRSRRFRQIPKPRCRHHPSSPHKRNAHARRAAVAVRRQCACHLDLVCGGALMRGRPGVCALQRKPFRALFGVPHAHVMPDKQEHQGHAERAGGRVHHAAFEQRQCRGQPEMILKKPSGMSG